ncbi:carboxypeptidase-like regulatory domain-containing protein [Winogradskyella endarachnes]|uniref:Carboxypeptidase-like regulatory domain-containing protein n=1 Tax=Winogradskyella endarachnes TaxID=2681965 RepID=A0A6L6UCU9_9FLAO|nr:carboxypeptidase-like regulatory domain-containing protein [Winogradskyella endarachnes]MUU78762.1 hypothetical protein [Winogradskyella endarachnes]
MKTQLTLPKSQHLNLFSITSFILLLFFSFNPIIAQTNSTPITIKTTEKERTVKGIVSDETERLLGVNILLEGTTTGTTTNEKGEFTFPKKLKTGDILLFSYLGYETQKVVIKDDTSFIKLKLTLDDVTMIGTLDARKPYKSKRKN